MSLFYKLSKSNCMTKIERYQKQEKKIAKIFLIVFDNFQSYYKLIPIFNIQKVYL